MPCRVTSSSCSQSQKWTGSESILIHYNFHPCNFCRNCFLLTVEHRSYSICYGFDVSNYTNDIGSVRSDPQTSFTGLLSLTIMEIKLALHYRRNMLMCTQWSILATPFFQYSFDTFVAAVSLFTPARLLRSARTATKRSNFS